jgi:hypothetical protein
VPNVILTLTEITEATNLDLGSSDIEVEVSADDVRRAINRATRVYNRYRPQRAYAKLAVSSSTKKYHLDHTGLQGVLDVSFLTPQQLGQSVGQALDPFLTVRGTDLIAASDTYGEIDQQLQYMEDARRISATDPDWFGQWESDGNYYLYVDIATGRTYDCSYLYVWHITSECVPDADSESGYGDYGLKFIPESDTEWFLDYVKVHLKLIVARKLRKFSGGIPTPEGGSESLDGESLMSEAREDEKDLLEEIRKRRRPLTPVIG